MYTRKRGERLTSDKSFRPRLLASGLLIVALVLAGTALFPARGQSPDTPPPGESSSPCFRLGHLPRGRLISNPGLYETQSQQVGGKGWGNYEAIGELRCPGVEAANEAIVGVEIRRGKRVDYMATLCGPIHFYKGGWVTIPNTGHWLAGKWVNKTRYIADYYGWDIQHSYPGMCAGNSAGGEPIYMTCPNNMMVSGFRAASVSDGAFGNFLKDLSIECARITGIDHHQAILGVRSGKKSQATTYFIGAKSGIDNANELSHPGQIRTWASRTTIGGAEGSNLTFPGRTQDLPRSYCVDHGATALSVAVGSYWYQPVIQAFQMFCGGITPVENGG